MIPILEYPDTDLIRMASKTIWEGSCSICGDIVITNLHLYFYRINNDLCSSFVCKSCENSRVGKPLATISPEVIYSNYFREIPDICEACGEIERLVRHHFYDKEDSRVVCIKYVCYSCNHLLKSIHSDKPSWDEQLKLVTDYKNEIAVNESRPKRNYGGRPSLGENAINRNTLGVIWVDKKEYEWLMETKRKTGKSPRKLIKEMNVLYDSGDKTIRKLFGE